MSTKTAQQIIRMEYGNSRNFMTPTVIEYGKIGDNTAYEISKGTGIFNPWIFGVSIVDYDPATNTTKRRESDVENGSCMVYSLNEAREYVESLKNQQAGINESL